MNKVRNSAILGVFILFGTCLTVAGQNTDCPADKVCISREAAVKLLQADDRAKALEAENAVLKQAVEDHKAIETTLKIELAKMSGELTGSQQMNVRQTAIIDVLIKFVRPKKVGLINLF